MEKSKDANLKRMRELTAELSEAAKAYYQESLSLIHI